MAFTPNLGQWVYHSATSPSIPLGADRKVYLKAAHVQHGLGMPQPVTPVPQSRQPFESPTALEVNTPRKRAASNLPPETPTPKRKQLIRTIDLTADDTDIGAFGLMDM